MKYVVDVGGHVEIPAIDAPESKFKNPEKAVKLSLDQEVHVTKQINALVDLARKENDHITVNFLQWFLTEQLEEVSSMDNLLKVVQRAGDESAPGGRVSRPGRTPHHARVAGRVKATPQNLPESVTLWQRRFTRPGGSTP